MKAPTKVMGIQEFGDALIRTRDLDPLYVGLVGANLPREQLARWLLAYLSFYHVGSASWMSEHEGENFWFNMRLAAENTVEPRVIQDTLPPGRWPRAAERRHFRGEKCVKAVEWLSKRAPEWWVMSLVDFKTDREIMSYVQTWPMFGKWVSFKAVDLLERVWGLPLQINPDIGLIYEAPRAALDLLPQYHPTWTSDTPEGYYQKLLTYFSAHKAPPRFERRVGPLEVESICCKWASMTGGHYFVGKDIHEQRIALAGWGETAARIAVAYPPEVPA